MADQEKEKIIPRRPTAIFIETSGFYNNPLSRFNSPEWGQLKELAKIFEIQIFTSKLVVDELTHNMLEIINGDFIKLKNSVKLLKGLTITDQNIGLTPFDESIILSQTKDRLPARFISEGIEILPNFNISLEQLLMMAVEKIAPFESKNEKGFRDSVALFTALEKAKELKLKSLIFIANDNGYYQEGSLKQANGFVEQFLICHSLKEGSEFLNNLLGHAVQKYISSQEKKLIQLIDERKQELEEYIRKNVSFPPSFLTRDTNVFGVVKSIKSVRVVKLGPAVFEKIPEEKYTGDVKVSCDIDLEIDLDIEPFKFPELPRLWVEGTKPISPTTSSLSAALLGRSLLSESSSLEYQKKTVTKKATMQAVIFSEKHSYSNLRIESITPSIQMADLFG